MTGDERYALWGPADSLVSQHFLRFNAAREVTRCHCGFEADPDDCGYGDSVLVHIVAVALAVRESSEELDDMSGSIPVRSKQTGELVHFSTNTGANSAICPDLLRLSSLGEADGWRGHTVRGFFWILRWVTGL